MKKNNYLEPPTDVAAGLSSLSFLSAAAPSSAPFFLKRNGENSFPFFIFFSFFLFFVFPRRRMNLAFSTNLRLTLLTAPWTSCAACPLRTLRTTWLGSLTLCPTLLRIFSPQLTSPSRSRSARSLERITFSVTTTVMVTPTGQSLLFPATWSPRTQKKRNISFQL